MTEKELEQMCTMDRFAGCLIAYITDYFQGCDVHGNKIDYEIPHADYFLENARDLLAEIRTLKPIREYTPKLKEIAIQYLPMFLEEFPRLAKKDCLKY